MITAQGFRKDYPVFSATAVYPDSLLAYWLQIGQLLLNQDRFGPPAPYQTNQVTLAGGGQNYAVGDIVNLAGGTYATPVSIKVSTLGANGAIATFTVLNNGSYTVLPSNPVGQLSTTGGGTGATFSLNFVSAPYTEYDFALELFIAHNIVLDTKAQNTANAGGLPGEMTGPASSKSVGGVSITYDVALAAIAGMGDWNLTIYGVRFARMVNQFGMGPLTISGRGCPSWLNGPGWPGPPFAQGVDWDM